MVELGPNGVFVAVVKSRAKPLILNICLRPMARHYCLYPI
jgi:hypothetical protein